MKPLIRVLVTLASLITIGFGAWHFFVPTWWDWYSYISDRAPELKVAVRAINFFFSLCLVLFGILGLSFVWRKRWDRFSLLLTLILLTILWSSRVILQLIYPQGSEIPVVQYSMLVTFIVVGLLYGCAAILLIRK